MKISIYSFIYFIFFIVFLFLMIDILAKTDFLKDYRKLVAIISAMAFFIFLILKVRSHKKP
jgi:hypothetical protein